MAQHCMEGMGEEKLNFLLLKLVKTLKSPVLGKVSQLILSPIEVEFTLAWPHHKMSLFFIYCQTQKNAR